MQTTSKAGTSGGSFSHTTTPSTTTRTASRIFILKRRQRQDIPTHCSPAEETQKLADDSHSAERTNIAAVHRDHSVRCRSNTPPASFFTWPCSCVICAICLLLIILLFLLSSYIFGEYFYPNYGEKGEEENPRRLAKITHLEGRQQPVMLMVAMNSHVPRTPAGTDGRQVEAAAEGNATRLAADRLHPPLQSADQEMPTRLEMDLAAEEGNFRRIERPTHQIPNSESAHAAFEEKMPFPTAFTLLSEAQANRYDISRELLRAAKYGKTERMRLLLDRHGTVNINRIRNAYGNSPLHLAATYGHVGTVRLLLERNADVRLRNSKSQTALYYAACEGKEQVMLTLIKAGADLNAKGKDGDTAVHCAAEEGWARIVHLLIENGAAVNARNAQGFTPLHLAAKHGKRDACLALLQNGADLESTVPTWNDVGTLHLAALEGHEQVIRQLLEWGANVAKRDRHGWTALHYAIRNGHVACVRLLLRHWGEKIGAREGAALIALTHREDVQTKRALAEKVFV